MPFAGLVFFWGVGFMLLVYVWFRVDFILKNLFYKIKIAKKNYFINLMHLCIYFKVRKVSRRN